MFIRTKDGIYEVEQSQLEDDEEVVNCDYGQIHKLEILRKSENIAELCDGVIEKCLSGNRFCPIEMFNKQEAIKCMNIDFNKGYKQFYFGIFVEHNNKIDFISVAKMNEEGKLCLI